MAWIPSLGQTDSQLSSALTSHEEVRFLQARAFSCPRLSLLLKSSFLLSFCSFIYPYLFFIVIFSLVEPTYMLLYNGERWSWRATLLQSLAPTLKNPGKKIPNCILKTLISWFRCVWLELELNSAGTPALQDQRSPPLLYNIRIFSSFLPPWVWGWVVTFIGFAVAQTSLSADWQTLNSWPHTYGLSI